MKKKKGFTLIELIIVIVILLMVTVGCGWFVNIYKLCHLDFEEPYKAEVIRVAGVFVPPMGAIVGWMDIEDGPESTD